MLHGSTYFYFTSPLTPPLHLPYRLDELFNIKLLRSLMKPPQQSVPPPITALIELLQPQDEELCVFSLSGNALRDVASHKDDAMAWDEVDVVGEDDVGLGEGLLGLIVA